MRGQRGRRREGGIGGEGGVELLLGFGEQSLGEVVAAELGVFGGLLVLGQGGEAQGADLVELEGGLPEAGFGVDAAQAGGGLEAAGGRGLAPGGDERAHLLSFGVGGLQL